LCLITDVARGRVPAMRRLSASGAVKPTIAPVMSPQSPRQWARLPPTSRTSWWSATEVAAGRMEAAGHAAHHTFTAGHGAAAPPADTSRRRGGATSHDPPSTGADPGAAAAVADDGAAGM
jgi:hypothetical protein